MGQLTPLLAGKLVAFDTGPLIYYIEEHPDYLSSTDELFSPLDSGAAHGMTSVLTLKEVLVNLCTKSSTLMWDRALEMRSAHYLALVLMLR